MSSRASEPTGAPASPGERILVGSFLRELLLTASREIELATAKARESAGDEQAYDPELTRKMRLSVRRVRYQLDALCEVERAFKTTRLVRKLGVVGQPFGALRDAQILEERVRGALGKRARTPQGKKLRKKAAEFRASKEVPVRDALDAHATDKVLALLNEYRRAMPFQTWLMGDVTPLARAVLKSSWRELERVQRRARRRPSDENLHAVRIVAKRTMYVAQAFTKVLGPPVEEFATRLNDLQQALGRQHDHVIVAKWLSKTAKKTPKLRKLARRLAADERRRARKGARTWRRSWRKVRDLEPRQLFRRPPGEAKFRAR